MIFDYFDTQYMFSSATVLALSVIRDRSASTSDRDRLECIGHFLSQLKSNGNFAAAEFHQHISAITSVVEAAETRLESRPIPTAAFDTTAAGLEAGLHHDTHNNLHGSSPGRLASEINLEEPLFRDLLAQSATDLQFIDDASFADTDLGLPWLNVDV